MDLIRSIVKPQFLFRPRTTVGRIAKSLRRSPGGRVEVRLPWSVSIRIDTGERIGRSIWRSGIHDLSVMEALWRLLDRGDTVIDVGANIGYTASLMARRTGSTGRVHCFEPHPEVFACLEENIALFAEAKGLAPIDAHRVALSDRTGCATFECGEGFAENRGSGRISSRDSAVADGSQLGVPTARLDDFLHGQGARLVKIDVEGHELQVLRGAEQALAAGRITHIIYEDFDGAQSAVHQLLLDRGYSVVGLGWLTHKPVLTPFGGTPSVDLAWESPNYLATRSPREARDRFKRWGWSVI